MGCFSEQNLRVMRLKMSRKSGMYVPPVTGIFASCLGRAWIDILRKVVVHKSTWFLDAVMFTGPGIHKFKCVEYLLTEKDLQSIPALLIGAMIGDRSQSGSSVRSGLQQRFQYISDLVFIHHGNAQTQNNNVTNHHFRRLLASSGNRTTCIRQ